MSEYTLIVRQKAQDDLKRIINYITHVLLNHKAAEDFIIKVENKYTSIKKNPHLYPVDRFGKNTYHFVMINKYMIVFRIDEQTHTVFILAIGHSLQKRRNIIKKA